MKALRLWLFLLKSSNVDLAQGITAHKYFA